MAAEAPPATEVAQTVVPAPPVTPDEPAAPPAPAPGGKAAGKDAKKPSGGKDAKKKPKREAASAAASDGPSVAAHPRAARQVQRAKAWGGLAGFALGGYLSLPTTTLADAGLRALIAGVVCYVAAWAAGVFVWRHLVVLEIKSREHQLLAAELAARQSSQGPPER